MERKPYISYSNFVMTKGKQNFHYIALLRGINVSGQKKIKMTDLISYCEELKFKNIKTYIQSGNVIFDMDNSNPEDAAERIEKKISEKYNFNVSVIVKTRRELINVIDKNPFSDKNTDRVYIIFLFEKPSASNIERLKKFDYSPEEFVIKGDIIYFYSPHGYGKAKMNNNFFENKLKVKTTTRNWKTVSKLAEMTGE
jgi:uncharacterized protein (DUF1697 family)